MAERNEQNPADPRDDEKRSRTDRGYDEAAHSGNSYGEYEGRGGVFGTTGGGNYAEGFQTLERPDLSGRGGDYGSPFDPPRRDRENTYSRRGLPYSEMAYSERGPYTGKGPKGYQRSDERIREDVNDRLWLNGAVDASSIEVGVEGGEVTLSGSVPDRRMKRMAAEDAEDVAGVRDVFNQIRVKRD